MRPGAGNVIPARSELVVDARAPDAERLELLERDLRAAAAECAREHGCEHVATAELRVEPVTCDARVREAIEQALPGRRCWRRGRAMMPRSWRRPACRSGMLFVRSRNGGVSHSPDELTDDADVAACVDTLRAVLGTISAWH